MSIQPNGPAPYAPVRPLVTVLDGHRDRGFQGPFTTEILVRAGVSETLAPRTLQALKLLDLVDGEGYSTDTFEAMRAARGDDDYRTRLTQWLNAVYADVLQFTDPAVDSPSRVEEAFRGYTPSGQRPRMASLMLGLFDYAGLMVNRPEKRSPAPKKTIARVTTRTGQKSMPADERVDGVPPALLGLLKQIPWGQGWSKDRRGQFLEAFEAVLDFSVPVRLNGSEPEAVQEGAER